MPLGLDIPVFVTEYPHTALADPRHDVGGVAKTNDLPLTLGSEMLCQVAELAGKVLVDE
jgi:hypothetical protein